MGLFSWIGQKLSSGKQAVVNKAKDNFIVRKVTESGAFQAAANGLSATLTFLRENRDGLNKAMMQFVAGLTRVTHIWKLLLLPIFYPDTYRAISAAQKRALLRLLTIFGYHQVLRPGLTGVSSLAHGYANVSEGYTRYAIAGAGYTLDGITMVVDSAVVIWTVREATTAMFLDNAIYNAAVAAASARDSSLPASANTKSTNPLMNECGDGGYFSAGLMNTATYIINSGFFVLTYYAPNPYMPVIYLARLANNGMSYRLYQTAAAGMCITHQNKYFRDKIFDALAEGVIAEMMYQGGMWMLTSATPYQIVAKFLPSAILNSAPVNLLSALLPFEPGFILAFTLSEAVGASSALTLIALGNMTRELEVPKGTDLFNVLYPAQMLTEKIGGYIEAQGSQQYKIAKQENPEDWVTVANDKLLSWWDGWLLWSFRKTFIRNCPETWDDLFRRPSVQVYWAASRGQLKVTVSDSLKQLTSPGAKVGRKLGISRFAGSLFFLTPETKAAIKYFLKTGVIRILRATDKVLQRVEVLDEVKPSDQPKQIAASAPVTAMTKMRATEPSRVNLHKQPDKVSPSPSNARSTSATSAGSVSDIQRQLMLVGGSRVKGLRTPSSVQPPRKLVSTNSVSQLDPVIDVMFKADREQDPREDNMTFLMEEAIVLPAKEKPASKIVEVLDEPEEQADAGNEQSRSAVLAESFREREDSVPPPLEQLLVKIEKNAAQVDDAASSLQLKTSVDNDDASPQMQALSREWEKRVSSPKVLVSEPVLIPVPQLAQPVKEVQSLSVEQTAKRGMSRVALGLRSAKK